MGNEILFYQQCFFFTCLTPLFYLNVQAVMSLNSIVTTVAKIDPDGVDIVCFPGSGGEGGFSYDIYRNIRDANGLEDLVTAGEILP